MTGTGDYSGQRLARLEALAARLREHGMSAQLLGTDDPVLSVRHPGTGRQTIVFATPAREGWMFLWAPGGQESADDPGRAAELIGRTLSPHP
ncbi:hypothetical protein [Microbispora bryophytorum]|uniref:Uncharacterized protein n=1 Tax=Microbispora bryophytorum TaxID=1460882 RepID=A0A8H9H8E3_9ACTN|nr:hypothetical protein [Microbispora bryophytorum]MBD3135293.1 hypothetical protein [Microbispora bryophytorum]TQS08506.1 hypothetical protein FLX07_04300 [Microbispora bryophytorum]GGO30435.1 hypothetical protein GCM10011574_66790 [Microbispora bryophytorum]